MQMKNKSQVDNWDYIIDGKRNGLTRIIIMSIISVFFTVLMVDQLKPRLNKNFIVAVAFGMIAVISIMILTMLIIRYCCFEICVGKDGFRFQSNPFNGRFYKYADINRCCKKLITSQHRTTSGTKETTYHYYFIMITNSGETQKIKFDKSLYEREFSVLEDRITNAKKDP